jgi:hypothetical protein
MVLLETALAIPLLVAVTCALCWGVLVGAATLKIGDAARSAARDLARGETVASVLARAQAAVPGAQIRIADEGELVAVVISEKVTAPVPILRGIAVTVTQHVAVPREWT